ncbi:alpha/beta hydrolase family esterase [Streptomyces sp. NPDC090442]|uniref:alpha/beta hydrolase family esterase n=1 Tax=Streptomyces sp. NPDC090442 TaxID=3365962 RepID=UPI0038090557
MATTAGRSASAGPTNGGSACTSAPNSSTTRTMNVGGQTRTFIEHVPANSSPRTKKPAIIAFHGRGETDSRFAAYSQLDDADAIVLYAQGLNGKGGKPSWEASPYIGAWAHDYEFATALVRWLAKSPCVDTTRIGMTGKSDGAGFAASAACRISGVAAVATISAAFYQDYNHCTAGGRPLPSLNMHGTADPVIPYDGKPARRLFSTDDWIQLWRERDHCTGPATDRKLAPDVVQTTWSSCASGNTVVNYRIIDGGHTWPGATKPSGPGGTTHSINAARTMMAFFTAHPLPRTRP